MAKKLIGNFMQIVVFTAKVIWLCYFPGDTHMISIFKSFLSDYVRFSRENYQSLTLKVKACLPMFSEPNEGSRLEIPIFNTSISIYSSSFSTLPLPSWCPGFLIPENLCFIFLGGLNFQFSSRMGEENLGD